MKFIKILFTFWALIFLNGCFQSASVLGPSLTMATSGNIFHAGFQYGANSAIKKETGKDALTLVKDVVENNSKQKKFENKFRQIVLNRIKNTKKKLSLN